MKKRAGQDINPLLGLIFVGFIFLLEVGMGFYDSLLYAYVQAHVVEQQWCLNEVRIRYTYKVDGKIYTNVSGWYGKEIRNHRLYECGLFKNFSNLYTLLTTLRNNGYGACC